MDDPANFSEEEYGASASEKEEEMDDEEAAGTEGNLKYRTKKLFSSRLFSTKTACPFYYLTSMCRVFLMDDMYKNWWPELRDNAVLLGFNFGPLDNDVLRRKFDDNWDIMVFNNFDTFTVDYEWNDFMLEEAMSRDIFTTFWEYFNNEAVGAPHKYVALVFFTFFVAPKKNFKYLARKAKLISFCMASVGNSSRNVYLPQLAQFLEDEFKAKAHLKIRDEFNDVGLPKFGNLGVKFLQKAKVLKKTAFAAWLLEKFPYLDIVTLYEYYLYSNFDTLSDFEKAVTMVECIHSKEVADKETLKEMRAALLKRFLGNVKEIQ